jgi:hypothetical protein
MGTAMRGEDIDIGTPPWTTADLIAEIDPFLAVYPGRPLADNPGGMGAPHCFYVWFLLRRLKPETVIESGVYKGQSTWLIEQACPGARILSIDPRPDFMEYRSARATYSTVDFGETDWTGLDPATTLVFFDDHQNAYERLKQCRWFGFRDLIFEDNYPALQGDVYSLKKVLAGTGFTPPPPRKRKRKLLPWPRKPAPLPVPGVAANHADATYLRRNVEVYYEFPPLFRTADTRWGDAWSDEAYPTKDPLFAGPADDRLGIFLHDARTYNWLCYVRL